MSEQDCGATHHKACKCREEYFAKLERERDCLRMRAERLEAKIEAMDSATKDWIWTSDSEPSEFYRGANRAALYIRKQIREVNL